MSAAPPLPRALGLLLAAYFAASLLHFAHNAAFIAYYPNMPAWITPERIWLAWLAVSSVGLVALVLTHAGRRCAGALCMAAYGAFGLDGLLHYTLALCSEHTLATHLTIALEAGAGLALLLASAVRAWRLIPRAGPKT